MNYNFTKEMSWPLDDDSVIPMSSVTLVQLLD